MHLLDDSWVVSEFLEYERLNRKAEVDLLCKFFGLEVNGLLENNSRSDIFDCACGPDIFHPVLLSCGSELYCSGLSRSWL